MATSKDKYADELFSGHCLARRNREKLVKNPDGPIKVRCVGINAWEGLATRRRSNIAPQRSLIRAAVPERLSHKHIKITCPAS
jgi:hypothetical protein